MGPARGPGWVCKLSLACSESREIEHSAACGPPYSIRRYTQLSMGRQRDTQHPPPQLCLVDAHLQGPFRFVPYCVDPMKMETVVTGY